MLRRVFAPQDKRKFEVRIADAAYPAPFAHRPEFNPPAHGVWNIVHVGMQLPEAQQIYVCAVNCMRGVVLTAAEMGCAERFSMVLLEEKDLLEGTVEDVTMEGVADVLKKLEERGKLLPAVCLFTVCTHRFLGCDLDHIYGELERKFPRVRFLRCFMEPISQKEGLTPDQRLRKAIYEPLEPCKARHKTAAVLGSDFKLDETSDLRRMLEGSGWRLMEIQDYDSYSAYQEMAEAELMLSVFPKGKYGAEQTAARLGRVHRYLPASFRYDEIENMERELAEDFSLKLPDFAAERARCEAALEQARSIIGAMPIYLDFTVHPRVLGLARLLVEHGFRVERVYLDSISGEEEEDLRWLREHAGDLRLCATMQPEIRVLPRDGGDKILAIGQIAAWAAGTPHFVNMVEGAGLWGFDGIRTMARMMAEAAMEKKDTRDLVPRKGLGCESCI